MIILTTADMIKKYHDQGTPVNVGELNDLKALPCRNTDINYLNALKSAYAQKIYEIL